MDSIIINNLIMTLILLGDDSEAEKFDWKLIKEHKKHTAASYFYVIWTAYKLQDYKRCLTYIEKAKHMSFDRNFHYNLILIVELMMQDKKIGKDLSNCYKMIRNHGSIAMHIFILTVLINYYSKDSSKQSLKQCCKYHSELFQLQTAAINR